MACLNVARLRDLFQNEQVKSRLRWLDYNEVVNQTIVLKGLYRK